MSITSNLEIEYLQPAQSQKHLTVNSALARIDQLYQIRFQESYLASPPSQPMNDSAVLVNDNPQEEFSGHAGDIAFYTSGQWKFITPKTGWTAYFVQDQTYRVFDGTDWIAVVTEPVTLLGINAQADDENRFIVKSRNSLFDHDGADHRLKINKLNSASTASMLFQTGYMSSVEIGTVGDDDFVIRTSGDGIQFKTILRTKDSLGVHFPHGRDSDLIPERMTELSDPSLIVGPPNVSTIAESRTNFTLLNGRVYFSPVFIDRPTALHGTIVALFNAAGSGAVLRGGIYSLGQSALADWTVGDKVIDLGSAPADQAGHVQFSLNSAIIVERGWYLFAVGCDGDGAEVRAAHWSTPGTTHYHLFGSGNTADIRLGGAARQLFDDNKADLIANGFPDTWPNNVTDSVSSTPQSIQIMLPVWSQWGYT